MMRLITSSVLMVPVIPPRVAASAVKSGYLSAEEAASRSYADRASLVFYPHVSSRAEATQLSGRGVGLDASHGGDLTPYARWVSALGLWPLGLLALALAALMARPTHRAPEPAVPLPQTPGKSAKP